MKLTFVKIPQNIREPLQDVTLETDTEILVGDMIPPFLKTIIDPDRFSIEAVPLKRMAPCEAVTYQVDDAENLAGVYAYHVSSTTGSALDVLEPNIRATCLSMACGLHAQRFHGDIYIGRLGYFALEDGYQLKNSDLFYTEIEHGCKSPDLRLPILQLLNRDEYDESLLNPTLPHWLKEAAKTNYEDAAALSILAKVMKQDKKVPKNISRNSSTLESIGESGYESDTSSGIKSAENENIAEEKEQAETNVDNGPTLEKTFITRVPLCLQCRCPSYNLCQDCKGMYFCKSPKVCKQVGWSHQCICPTWKIYTKRRKELGKFSFEWHTDLITRENQLSEEPYKEYLMKIGVLADDTLPNWWTTEVSGWSGGQSEGAKSVALDRLDYHKGFALESDMIPPERPITSEDVASAGIGYSTDCKLVDLNSWDDYYKLRGIPLESPVALLMTFPLSIYYALLKYGSVPITVANMLNRSLRIHVVGIEKEMNFIDLFKEIGYLLPQSLNVEMVFIVREDMIPEACLEHFENGKKGMKIKLTSNLTIILQGGTYNDSLDPNFDCGSGPPDMIIALNAGLYAYESWRNVIEFLDASKGCVGVFTDYNEHSGLNCASLGGSKARESLSVNPFRQPHAMPVFSMNLPQFSNGFMYVFNEQELE